jgi:hypothetical protein
LSLSFPSVSVDIDVFPSHILVILNRRYSTISVLGTTFRFNLVIFSSRTSLFQIILIFCADCLGEQPNTKEILVGRAAICQKLANQKKLPPSDILKRADEVFPSTALCHRPTHGNELPTTLSSHILAKFYSRLHGNMGHPTKKDCAAAVALIKVASIFYERETPDMNDALNNWARDSFGWKMKSIAVPDGKTDGTVELNIHDINAPLLNR